MAGARDESVVDREPAGVRVRRPSRFGVVSLVVLLALGCGINLYLAYRVPPHRWFNRVGYYKGTPKHLPSLDPRFRDAVVQESSWVYNPNLTKRKYVFVSKPSEGWPQTSIHHYEFGFPLPTRSVTNIIVLEQPPSTPVYRDRDFIWTSNHKAIGMQLIDMPTGPHDYERFHISGLILNPIIYALPIWLIVMGVRWAFVTRRSRKRARLGLCVGCAYELAGLGVCPECGRERA